MRIAVVNATGGGLSGGYFKYLRSLIPRLARHPEVEQVDVFAPETARERFRAEPWPIHTWAAHDVRAGFRGLRERVRDRRPDVVFVPTAKWLDFGDTPVVVMVRNMEPLELPFGGNPVAEGIRNLARRTMARRACRRASRVIAVSNHVRDYLTDRWRIESGRIAVIYHGVDPPDLGPPPHPPPVLQDKVDRAFVFAAGSIRPSRGLGDLVEALPYLGIAGQPVLAVVAGQVDSTMVGHGRWLIRRSGELGVADRITWAGALSEAEMRWCYERSAAFVMTSRTEACPNIALEAMSYGCACVSVDRPPMPEFFGSAAVYYPAGDAKGLSQAFMSLVSGPLKQGELKAAASEHSRLFDWRITVDRTIDELRTAIDS